jgi:hypothetical protein
MTNAMRMLIAENRFRTSDIVSNGLHRLISLIASQFPHLSPRQAKTRAHGIAAAQLEESYSPAWQVTRT